MGTPPVAARARAQTATPSFSNCLVHSFPESGNRITDPEAHSPEAYEMSRQRRHVPRRHGRYPVRNPCIAAKNSAAIHSKSCTLNTSIRLTPSRGQPQARTRRAHTPTAAPATQQANAPRGGNAPPLSPATYPSSYPPEYRCDDTARYLRHRREDENPRQSPRGLCTDCANATRPH